MDASHALRNRRVMWSGSAAARDLLFVPGAGSSGGPDARADGGDAGHRDCACGDGCTGYASPGCNGHADRHRGAHGTAVDDGHAEHPDANCYTACYLTHRDLGDEQPDAFGAAANGAG